MLGLCWNSLNCWLFGQERAEECFWQRKTSASFQVSKSLTVLFDTNIHPLAFCAPLVWKASKPTLGSKLILGNSSAVSSISCFLLAFCELFQEEWDHQFCKTKRVTDGKQSTCSSGSNLAVVQKARLKPLKRTAMKSDDQPVLHVTGGLLLCIVAVASGILDGAHTDTGYEHYAEPTVAGMPAFLAMPANCLINLAYILLGWYWWPPGGKNRHTCYFQEVFALMALIYGPTQWVRLWTQHHWAAVLDQWLTLPIFAWVIVWCLFLEYGWQPYVFLATEVTSLTSYFLVLLHPQGFELALGGHIFVVFWTVLKVQRHLGNASSTWIIVLGTISCLGFVSLKVWDQELAQWTLFSQLTGHFWSKICDVLQFHCAFLFLTLLSRHRLSSQ